ncbi:MAG: hypothetical protein PHN89_05555 [Candidatus Pacebacteria bacterium]|nr:hypothetical protein [Candidatus Paceibacterota bacterium]
MDKIQLIKALLCEKEGSCESDFKVGGSKVKIVILQRGWVFVGYFSKEGSTCKLTSAKNIRTWGTTKGLGELAEDGVTSSTKLDPVNDVTFHELTSVAILDCNDGVWKKILA